MIIYTETLAQKWRQQVREKLFVWLTQPSPPLLLRARDAISIAPQVTGFHEKRICDLVEHYADKGLNDFFIDIGANIGLNTCQSGHLFKEIHCFEPNPDCFAVLALNTKGVLDSAKVHLHPYGLGTEDGRAQMRVPKKNWGGGFIHDRNNAYTDEQLLSKDGSSAFDTNNFNTLEIRIKSAQQELATLFRALQSQDLCRGFIKIDVEGYESVIVRALSASLPPGFEVVILFECFDRKIDPYSLIQDQHKSVRIFKLVRHPEKKIPKLQRAWQILRHGGYRYQLDVFEATANSSDVVVEINT
jgi:FkbM family methyltransferase